MNKPPEITVILPTYKRPFLLKRAIDSVLCQTVTNFKVCIYDNCSNDETPLVVKEIMDQDSRVLYHCHDRNIGPGANFNYGLMRVDTPFFSFLSDDDFLLPDFFKTALEGFSSYPEAAFSAASVITMTDRGKILYEPFSLWKKEGKFDPPEGLLETLGGKYPIWTGILFRREVINLTGGLDLKIGAADLDFVNRIAARKPYVISKKPAALCVNHEDSSSFIAPLPTYWPSWIKMIENITNDNTLPVSVKDKFETAMNEQLYKVLMWIGVRSFECGNFNQAMEASQILSKELHCNRQGHLLSLLVRFGRQSKLFRHVAAAFLALRRKFYSLINVHRIRLQKRHGHLADLL